MSKKKQPIDLGLLEEDNEFEDFLAEDLAGLNGNEDAHVWEDNWDDDNLEDDFSNQLCAELGSMVTSWRPDSIQKGFKNLKHGLYTEF